MFQGLHLNFILLPYFHFETIQGTHFLPPKVHQIKNKKIYIFCLENFFYRDIFET